jgi:hypothetical protein
MRHPVLEPRESNTFRLRQVSHNHPRKNTSIAARALFPTCFLAYHETVQKAIFPR